MYIRVIDALPLWTADAGCQDGDDDVSALLTPMVPWPQSGECDKYVCIMYCVLCAVMMECNNWLQDGVLEKKPLSCYKHVTEHVEGRLG